MWIPVACQLAPTNLSDSRKAKGMSRTWRRRSQPLQPMASTQAMRNVIYSVCCNYHWPPWFVYWYTYYQQRECSWYFLCSIFGVAHPIKASKGVCQVACEVHLSNHPKKVGLTGNWNNNQTSGHLFHPCASARHDWPGEKTQNNSAAPYVASTWTSRVPSCLLVSSVGQNLKHVPLQCVYKYLLMGMLDYIIYIYIVYWLGPQVLVYVEHYIYIYNLHFLGGYSFLTYTQAISISSFKSHHYGYQTGRWRGRSTWKRILWQSFGIIGRPTCQAILHQMMPIAMKGLWGYR